MKLSICSQINSPDLLINIFQPSKFVQILCLNVFSEPSGSYIIMAIDESEETYNHTVRVLLDAAIDSPVDLL